MKATRSLQALWSLRLPRLRTASSISLPNLFPCATHGLRQFQTSCALHKIQTHTLSDIGEGVKEVQIIQWFVEEGAAVEEWAPLCEVQSDKASVEITSKYTGVIKKLHFERDAIVQVGDTMLDIEVEEEQDDAVPGEAEEQLQTEKETQDQRSHKEDAMVDIAAEESSDNTASDQKSASRPGKHASLATPAVRGLLKDHKLEISDIKGTGKDGRVLKEDIYRHLENGKPAQSSRSAASPTPQRTVTSPAQTDTVENLTPIQSAMFKSMTKSLSIPHFLYSDKINITSLSSMRARLNASRNKDTTPKFSYLPFVIKAVSLALREFPILNAKLDLTSDPNRPKLAYRSNHNISVAMDTPSGLLVPVIKSVNTRSITSIALEIQRLSELGRANKFTSDDLSGGTITVSNIGNIGGEAVGPVIVENQLAILGLGKIKPTPVFAADGKTVERADLMNASWSADHRVIDGATMARMAVRVQKYLEEPESMLVDLS